MSVGDFEIFPVHSFESNSPCADERLGVELAQYSDHIDLSYKAFRFRDGTSGIGFLKRFNNCYSAYSLFYIQIQMKFMKRLAKTKNKLHFAN